MGGGRLIVDLGRPDNSQPTLSAARRGAARRRRDTTRHDTTRDWNAFTPWSALAGGALIGLAPALPVLLDGRIAGISGVLGGLLEPARGDIGWRVAFVLGLIAAPLCFALFGESAAVHIDAGNGSLIVAGLLVGVGTRYGGGCTSGHGVCGLSRRSLRSLAATAAFDSRPIFGSTLFGIGWGLAGFCPGPALVALGMGQGKTAVFILATLVGMQLFEWLEARRRSATVVAA